MKLGSFDDLLSRLEYSYREKTSARPVAYLTGSGISFGAVPMSNEIINIARKAFVSPDDLIAFDAAVSEGTTDGEKYTKAFQFLTLRRGGEVRDRVIRASTLRAFDSKYENLDARIQDAKDSENDPSQDGPARWKNTVGQESLGRILAGLPANRLGPVLTTNFDPLTEKAILRAGGYVTAHRNPEDTPFLQSIDYMSHPHVVHLHGLWNDSITSSTADQLENPRPATESSIRQVLEKYTLLVVGYSGWKDVATKVIQQQIHNSDSRSLDVLWCIHASGNDAEAAINGNPVVSNFVNSMGNIQFYCGIDSNNLFPKLEGKISDLLEYPSVRKSEIFRPTAVGWTQIDQNFLERNQSTSDRTTALKFYDGRVPAWHDIVNEFVPIRQASSDIANRIVSASIAKESTLTLLLGPAAEGKTTVGMQVASIVARQDRSACDVLYFESDYLIDINRFLINRARSRGLVLIVDEAYRFVSQLESFVAASRDYTGSNIHILAISRDSDWIAAGGFTTAWDKLITTRTERLKGLSRLDAVAMIDAWERHGEEALGDLGVVESSESRVNELLEVSIGLAHGEGSLLGALLSVRLGEGFRAHIELLMDRLNTRLISSDNNDYSLLDAMIMISIPYAYGVMGVDLKLLGEALNMDSTTLKLSVLDPLGEEAVVGYAGDSAFLRHELIASTVLDICLARGYQYAALLSTLVGVAARRFANDLSDRNCHDIAFISNDISDLPDLAVAAAEAAQRSVPESINFITHLSHVYRVSGYSELALELNRSSLRFAVLESNSDSVRGYFCEWGVVEGVQSDYARNTLLAAFALADSPILGRMRDRDLATALSCLCYSIGRLDREHCSLVQGTDLDLIECSHELIEFLAAVTVLMRDFGLGRFGGASRTWLREAERTVDRHSQTFPSISDLDYISTAFANGVSYVSSQAVNPLPSRIVFGRGCFDFFLSKFKHED